jgi:serine/threonine protein kinase/WD40 repeat protein
MAVALEEFVKQIEDSGVIAPGKLDNFVPPKAHPKDAQELARQLVQSRHLTKFQAQEIYQGRAKSLILGNYTILDKIGAGGMGQVFKAEHRRMKRTVAIKMLSRNLTKDALSVARFQREVEAAAKLSHPNIVAAHDADEARGVHFLVMEYVDGSDLSALVKKHGPLSVAKAVNYVLQAARGLEFAHKKGVIHRDVKPGNLLLDAEGAVKILDMGLARLSCDGNAATQAELTGTGAVLGTVDYMAPEQAVDTKHADARADIYSLGCTLYYLLSGKAAYEGDTLMAKLLAHREAPLPSLGDNVPEQVQAVFRKMAAKRIADRYQTMSEVVTALEAYSSGQQTSLSIQPSAGTGSSSDVLTFLRNVTLNTFHKAKPTRKPVLAANRKKNKTLIPVAVAAAFLGLAILAGVVFKVLTREGTLVVKVDQPDAVVQVLNEEGKVEITRPGEKGTLSIAVDPGKHRLKVEKDGFQFFTQDFTMEAGGTQSIKATLEPVKAGENAGRASKPWNTPAFQQGSKDVGAPHPAVPPFDARKTEELQGAKTRPAAEAESEAVVFQGHAGICRRFAFSPNGKQMASGGDDHVLRLWSLEERKEILQLKGHTAGVGDVAFSADGRKMLSCSSDKTIRLWDLETGKEIARLDSPAAVDCVVFVPGERQVLAACGDDSIRLWDLESRQVVPTFHCTQKKVFRLEMLPDGHRFLSADFLDRTLSLWYIEGGKPIRTFPACGECVPAMALTADGRQAVSGSYDRILRLWNVETGGEILNLVGHTSRIWCVAISQDGRFAASGASNYEESDSGGKSVPDAIRLWDLSSGHQIASYHFPVANEVWVRCVGFSSDNRYLYGSNDGGLICRWRLPDTVRQSSAAAADKPRGGDAEKTQ